MVGMKQQKIIEKARIIKNLCVEDIRYLYPQRIYAIASLNSLLAQGYFTKKTDEVGRIIWVYSGKE